MAGKETRAQRIRKMRQTKNLTQAQLSEITGISQPYIAKIESDKSDDVNISHEILAKLAEAFDVDIDLLKMHDTNIMHLPDYLREFVCDQDAMSYIKKAYIEYEYDKLHR